MVENQTHRVLQTSTPNVMGGEIGAVDQPELVFVAWTAVDKPT